MEEIKDLFSEEVILNLIKLVFEFLGLVVTSLLGVFTRELIFSIDTNWRKSWGFSILAGATMLLAKEMIVNHTQDIRYVFGITLIFGFIFPIFKHALKTGKFFFRLGGNLKDAVTSTLETLEEMADEEEEIKRKEED